MNEIRHILCPVDFSEFSRRALDHAAAMAKWYQARLVVLYVFQTLPPVDLPPMVLEEKDRERIVNDLRRFTAHVPREVPLDLRVEQADDVRAEILGQAAAMRADLLVIGSHGRSGFERLLLGSVTERLLHKAVCPTMIVPRRSPESAPDAPVRFRQILCGVDFSEGSHRALTQAIGLAGEAGAHLTVLHVIELPPELRENPLAEGFDVDSVRAAAEADCLRRLRDLIPKKARASCTVETAVREGAAYREILKVAAEQEADLIVMGVQGRGAWNLLVFGSNTARVARAATCPVLILPAAHG